MFKWEKLLVSTIVLIFLVRTSIGGNCREGDIQGGHHGGGGHNGGGGHHGGDSDSDEDCHDHGGGGGSKPPPFNPGQIVGIIGLHGVEYSYAPYTSWSSQIRTSTPFLITYPKNKEQVIRVVSWAATSGRNVRVQGYKHSYPPLTIGPQDDASKIVLIDMTKYLYNMRMASMQIPSRGGLMPSILNTVVVDAGASMESLMSFAEANGFGVVMTPIIGRDATVGGVLAIGGHGAGIPAMNERLKGPGFSFGSVSNLIVELKAVVLDPATGRWGEKVFSRWDPETAAYMVHIGRAVITEATLMVGKNYDMRCLSRVDISASELFAHPSNSRDGFRTMAKFIDEVGRVDAIWYPFTDNPWLKLWIVRKSKPSDAKVVYTPYNYQFPTAEINPQTPGAIFGPQAFRNLMQGLTNTNSWDIWGPSKNTILYYNTTSTPIAYSGWVVLTSRANIQQVIYEITLFYTNLINEFGGQSVFPIDQYIKLRVTGLDDPFETRIPNAASALISPLTPVPARPDWDVGVWMNTVTTTRRPWSDEFMRRFEEWAYTRFNGEDSLARPEWSKNWGHSSSAPFGNSHFIQEIIPKYAGIPDWNKAISIFNKYDPNYVVSNTFLRQVLVPYQGSRDSNIILDVGDDEKSSTEQGGLRKRGGFVKRNATDLYKGFI